MWTRARAHHDPADPTAEAWLIRDGGEGCGTVWRTRDAWYWVTWTLPREAGQAQTMEAALSDARAAVLRTDGTINQLRSLTGPDFPDDRKRWIRR